MDLPSAPGLPHRRWAWSLVVLGWFAILHQLVDSLERKLSNGVVWWRALWDFFSYFTIQTNLALVILLTLALWRPDRGRWRHWPALQAAMVSYMLILGSVYEIMLRHLWQPSGLTWFCDLLLHDVLPLGYLCYWLFCQPPANLGWRHGPLWLSYPLLYLGYALLRGEWIGYYPYPFIDVRKLGYAGMAENAAMLSLAFVLTGTLVVWLDKHLKPRLIASRNRLPPHV